MNSIVCSHQLVSKIPEVATDFKSYRPGHYPNNFFMIPTDSNDVTQTATK